MSFRGAGRQNHRLRRLSEGSFGRDGDNSAREVAISGTCSNLDRPHHVGLVGQRMGVSRPRGPRTLRGSGEGG